MEKRYSPVFQWDAADFITKEAVKILSDRQLGSMLRKAGVEARKGNSARAKALPWEVSVRLGSRRRWIPKHVRRQVLAAGKCAWCGSVDRLEVDHIIPVAKDGPDHISNFQCLCKPCNIKKRDRIPTGTTA